MKAITRRELEKRISAAVCLISSNFLESVIDSCLMAVSLLQSLFEERSIGGGVGGSLKGGTKGDIGQNASSLLIILSGVEVREILGEVAKETGATGGMRGSDVKG